MEIMIDVSGSVYTLPLTGESITTENPKVTIRCVGVPTSHSGISPYQLAEDRRKRILSVVPSSPGFITISEVTEILPDVSRDTVRRALMMFEKEGKVRSVRPKSTARGQSARRYAKSYVTDA